MAVHLQRDLDFLKRLILAMGAQVEEALTTAIVALVDRRPELADRVIKGDTEIDRAEVHVEEECLKVLALHQPVATDLRYVVTVMKVNNDLERMGDLASNVAERAAYLSAEPPLGVSVQFPEMSEAVRRMVRDALDALLQMDVRAARSVLERDDEVDVMHAEAFTTLAEVMKRDPATIDRAVHSISASRNLERIADLATNVAEDVIFLVEGKIVRHGHTLEREKRREGTRPPA